MKNVYITKATFDQKQPKFSLVYESENAIHVFLCLHEKEIVDKDERFQYEYDFAEFTENKSNLPDIEENPEVWFDAAQNFRETATENLSMEDFLRILGGADVE